MNTENLIEKFELPENKDFVVEAKRTEDGYPAIAVQAKDSKIHPRETSAFVYEIAARIEECCEKLETNWYVVPELSKRQVVIKARDL